MSVTLVSIGDEVLLGKTLNTNASYLAQKLDEMGLVVKQELTLPDDPDQLVKELTRLLKTDEILIATGGLGPTLDDHTRKVAAKLFSTTLEFNEVVAKDLTARYGDKLQSLKDQATQPKGAKILLNSLGTAPGLVFEDRVFFLPGVPHELKAMFETQVTPMIHAGQIIPEIRLHFFRLIESEVDPVLRALKEKYPKLQFGIYPALGTLSVCIRGEGGERAKEDLLNSFGDFFYQSPSGKLEEALYQIFTLKKLTLSLAESCTGGSVASAITSIPGASNYFLGSIVSYANQVKSDVLQVSKEVIDRFGAVSEEVVHAMASNALEIMNSDVAAAISGIAGPAGGTPEKPVGTVWLSIVDKKGFKTGWKIHVKGNREMVIKKSVNALLGALVRQYG